MKQNEKIITSWSTHPSTKHNLNWTPWYLFFLYANILPTIEAFLNFKMPVAAFQPLGMIWLRGMHSTNKISQQRNSWQSFGKNWCQLWTAWIAVFGLGPGFGLQQKLFKSQRRVSNKCKKDFLYLSMWIELRTSPKIEWATGPVYGEAKTESSCTYVSIASKLLVSTHYVPTGSTTLAHFIY